MIMTSKVLLVFAFVPILGLTIVLEKGEKCINKKGETATCTNVLSCKAVIDAMAAAESSRIRVAGKECGSPAAPLVCCQTPDDFAKTFFNKTSNNNESTAILNAFDDLDIIMNYPENSTTPSMSALSNRIDADLSSTISAIIDVRISGVSTSSDNAQADGITKNTDAEIVSILTNPPPSTESENEPNPVPLLSPGSSTLAPSASNVIAETSKQKPNDDSSTTFSINKEPENLARKTPISVKKLLPDRHTCGLQTERRRSEGEPTAGIDEFPWTALLRYTDAYGYDAGFRCSATLINDRYVVTAAHCVATGPDYLYLNSVRLGEWVISSLVDCAFDYYREECNDRVEEVGIRKKIVHPQYDPTYKKNDVALIAMDRKLNYTGFIRPICLPVQNLTTPSKGSILTTSGWGTTRYGYFLDIKSKGQVSVWDNYECIRRALSYSSIFSDQICIGKTNPYDSCTPDSGGPLMAIDKEDKPQWYLEGVMSTGAGCSKGNYFGIYTRISDHIEWILETLGEGLP